MTKSKATTRDAMVAAMRKHPDGTTTRQIQEEIGHSLNAIQNVIKRNPTMFEWTGEKITSGQSRLRVYKMINDMPPISKSKPRKRTKKSLWETPIRGRYGKIEPDQPVEYPADVYGVHEVRRETGAGFTTIIRCYSRSSAELEVRLGGGEIVRI